MQQFIGTKRIQAKPMNRLAYNVFRGCKLPEDEDGSDEGYLVEYLADGESNFDDYEGYVSWSPKEPFEAAYQASGNMTFGHAVELMKAGHKVARQGWNGKGMFLFLVDGSTFKVNRPPLLGIFEEGTEIVYRPHIDMKAANGDIGTWVASQSDIIESDWVVVE